MLNPVAGDSPAATTAGDGTGVVERLTRLARVATELQSVADLRGLTDVVITHLADAAGSPTASLSVAVDEDTLAVVGIRGAPAGAAERYASYAADGSTPAGAALQVRQPLLLAGRATILSAYPDLELAAPGERSILCLPLVVGDRAVGVVSLSFPGVVTLEPYELEFFQVMADACAQALERIRAQETVAAQNAKLTFLARASEELASSLDYESTLRNVAWLAVPDLADWCAISLAQDGVLRTLAVAHHDPAKVALAEEFQRRYPPDPESGGGSYQVLRTGESLLVPEVTDEMLVEAAVDETHLQMLRDLALHSGLTVPLVARGRVLGTISWVNGENGRRFTPEDVSFGEDLARRAGVAIDNALLHSELRQVADQLQQAVMPPSLPEVAGWQLAAAYTSAGRVDVGGDFYDVIPLRDGRLVLAIGDVMGRGVEAAAAMTQVRAAVRALVAVDPDPEVVLDRLDLLYDRFPSDQLVTLAYALVDPARDELAVAAAGHPAPVLVDAAGEPRVLEGVRGTILGVEPGPRCATLVRFGAGETLVLFTDGLLERRDEDLEDGQRRLLRTWRELRPHPTSEELARLVAVTRDPSRDDDVAVLAARRR